MEARRHLSFLLTWSKPSIICRASLSLRLVLRLGCIPSWFGPGQVPSMGLKGGSKFGPIRPPLRSVTGFAEGCGLSCVAMAVTNLALHAHVADILPRARLATYVDNWEGIAEDPASLVASYHALKQFADAWDLLLDEQKTFAWASDSHHRKALRGMGFHTALHCRDLGAHLQHSRRCTNATLTRRLSSLEPLVDQASVVLCSPKAKGFGTCHPARFMGWRTCMWVTPTFASSVLGR